MAMTSELSDAQMDGAADAPPHRVGDRLRFAALAAAVVAPLVAAAGATAVRGWTPVGELAQAELRMRGFWSSPPLVGSVARLQVDGRTTSHPGPLAFWLLEPLYALGRNPVALSTAQAVLAGGWIVGALWLVRRRVGWGATVAMAVAAVLVVRALGAEVAVQPWNPWLAVPPFLCLVVAVWAAIDGEDGALVVVTVAASVAVQAHLGYVPLAVPLALAAAGVVAWRARRTPATRRPLAVALLAGGVSWLPPLVQQFGGSPGNLGQLWAAYRGPGEPAAGWAAGVRIAAASLDVTGPWAVGTSRPPGDWLAGGGTAVFVLAWGRAVLVAVRGRAQGRRSELLLHAVAGAGVVLGVATTAAVRGEVHDYLIPWWSVLAAVIAAATAWTLGVEARRVALARVGAAGARRSASMVRGAGVGLLVVVSVLASVQLGDPPVPSGRLAPSTAELTRQVLAGVDADRSYLVRWEDPVAFGGIGYGLILGLDRAGVVAGGLPVHRAASTDRFTIEPADADAVLVVVTGPRIEAWQSWAPAEEVAADDPRSPVERRRWEAVRDDLRARLGAVGGVELAARVDDNLWVARSDPRVSDELRDVIDAAARIPQPSAVFLTSTEDPGPPTPN